MLASTNSPTITERLQAIEAAHDEEKQELVRQFWQRYNNQSHDDEPIPENDTQCNVTFFYRGAEKYVCSDFCGLLEDNDQKFKLTNIPDTDIYYLTRPLRNDLRAEYIFHDGILDNAPWNDRRALIMPKAPPQPDVPESKELATQDLEKMKEEKRFVEFDIDIQDGPYKGPRKCWVHLPKDYDSQHEPPYPLLILLDGGQYHHHIPTPSIMDNMIEKNKILPTVTVLIENAGEIQRFSEYNCNDGFTNFIAHFIKEELPKQKLGYDLILKLVNEKPTLDKLQAADHQLPVLVKHNNSFYIYGFTQDGTKQLVELDGLNALKDLDFNSENKKIRVSNTSFPEIYEEIASKKGHTQKPAYLDEPLRVSTHPEDISICGSSAGGLAAVYAGLTRPDIFGNVISLSSAIWKEHEEGPSKKAITTAIEKFPNEYKQSSRFYIEVGTEEINQIVADKTTGARHPSMLETNQNMHAQMDSNKMQVSYHEFAGGHNDICWQGAISEPLMQIYNPDKVFAKTENKTDSIAIAPNAMDTATSKVKPISSTARIADQLHISLSTPSISTQQYQNEHSEVKKLEPTKKEKPAPQPLAESSTTQKITPSSTTPKPGGNNQG